MYERILVCGCPSAHIYLFYLLRFSLVSIPLSLLRLHLYSWLYIAHPLHGLLDSVFFSGVSVPVRLLGSQAVGLAL